jgi:hypothetical protein
MATLYLPDGTEKEVTPADGHSFTLEEIQAFVGGYFETVFLPGKKIMWINEEGKLRNLPLNRQASIFYHAPGDVILGPALVTTIENTGTDEERTY